MRVLIVGPSIDRSKGGTASVIREHLDNGNISGHNRIKYLVSHVDGHRMQKYVRLAKCVLHIAAKHKRYDVVHIHANSDISFYRKTILLRLSKALKMRTILHIHGHDFDSFYLKSRPLMKWYIRSSLRKSDRILVLSEYWRRFFEKEFEDLPTEVVHNAVDVAAYVRCIREPISVTRYLFLGRLGERKGTYDLLQAIDIVVNSHGRRNLQFALAGDGDIERVRAIVEEKRLTENVRLLGWIIGDEKKEMLKQAEVVLLPSYEENLPMALIEAMACGKVIISTFAGGIPDLVEPGENGYLFNAGDIEGLVRYILFVTDHPEVVRRMGVCNIVKITQAFNLDTISVKLNAIYESVAVSNAREGAVSPQGLSGNN